MTLSFEYERVCDVFKHLARRAREIAISKGWEDELRTFGDKIALMHTELSEAVEAYRHSNPMSEHIPDFTSIEEEMADVIIRVLHYSSEADLRIGAAILAKLDYNASRPHRHGGKAL